MSIESSEISVLVVGGSGMARLEYAVHRARSYGASAADTITITPSSDTTTIAIGQIRELTGRLSFAPYNSSCTVALLTELHTATIEAQQALLKMIEEPPTNTYIIGTTSNVAGILPTIVSRCNVIELTRIMPRLSAKQTEHYRQELEQLCTGGVPIRLEKAEQLSKDKTSAMTWLQEMTLLVRLLVIGAVQGKKPDTSTLSAATLAILLHKLIASRRTLQTTNTNVRLLIENFLLEFPKSP